MTEYKKDGHFAAIYMKWAYLTFFYDDRVFWLFQKMTIIYISIPDLTMA